MVGKTDIHFVLSISLMKVAGLPNFLSFAASFSHKVNTPLSFVSRFVGATVLLSPKAEFCAMLPLVTKTISSGAIFIDCFLSALRISRLMTVLLSLVNSISVTSVSVIMLMPSPLSQKRIGLIIASYSFRSVCRMPCR